VGILTVIRSELGKIAGYGNCYKCGLAWNVVEGYMIPYERGSSMFPICEKCFKEASIKEIEGYIDRLVDIWDCGGTHNGMTYGQIRINAKRSAHKIKEELCEV